MSVWLFAPLRQRSYGVILVDPAWRFETWSPRGQGKAASQYYDVMSLGEIMTLPVAELATDDAALMLWFPQNFGEPAYATMRAWGFEPKTLGTWAKQSKTGTKWAFGTGKWLHSTAEFFLLGTRGRPRVTARSERNLIVAPVREHSRKPDEMHRKLERMFPHVLRCELFARRRVEGWDCWGEQLNDCETLPSDGRCVAAVPEQLAFRYERCVIAMPNNQQEEKP
jgi:N6-adenosine-specific RNA methylase IME4